MTIAARPACRPARAQAPRRSWHHPQSLLALDCRDVVEPQPARQIPPRRAIEPGDDPPLELLMQPHSTLVVVEHVGKNRQRELRRPAAAISPFEAGGRMVVEIQAQ